MKPPKRLLVPAAVVLVAAVVFVVRSRERQNGGMLMASGTVEATEAQLGFQVAGRVDSVRVREGDAVHAGQELARLERTETLARAAQARAQVNAARATLAELESGFRSEEIAQARAGRDAALQRRLDAVRDLERTQTLRDGGAVSQEALDKASLAVQLASSQAEQAEQQLQLLERGPRPEQIAAQRAQLEQAEAAQRVIDAVLDNMVIRAPWNGIVTVRHHEPGEVTGAGTAILTLQDRDDRWVRIYVPEPRIAAVHLGQAARIRCDTHPDRDYHGEVTFIASEAEFTPKTVQTTEERVKLVYAVKVTIRDDAGFDLKPGMPVDVHLETGP